MMDAINRFRMLQSRALQPLASQKPVQQTQAPVQTAKTQFGQSFAAIQGTSQSNGDVFVKSVTDSDAKATAKNPPTQAAFSKPASVKPSLTFADARPNHTLIAFGHNNATRVQNFNPGLSPHTPIQNAAEQNLLASGKAKPGQPDNAQANTRRPNANLFAGAAATTMGLGALTTLVAAPAALASQPALVGKLMNVLPTQLP